MQFYTLRDTRSREGPFDVHQNEIPYRSVASVNLRASYALIVFVLVSYHVRYVVHRTIFKDMPEGACCIGG